MTTTDDNPYAANAMARRNRARDAATRAYNATRADDAYAARHHGVEAAIGAAVTVANLPDIVGAAQMTTLGRVWIPAGEATLLIRAAFEAAGFEVTQ